MTAGIILSYLAQSAIFLTFGYVCFKAFLAKVKQPAVNRAVLIAIYLAAFILPLLIPGGRLHTDAYNGTPADAGVVASAVTDELSYTAREDKPETTAETAQADETPLAPFDDFTTEEAEITVADPVETPRQATLLLSPAVVRIFLWIGAIGSLGCLLQLVFGFGKIVMLTNFSEETRREGMRIFTVQSRRFSPFSILNCIFIPVNEMQQSEDMIVAHEMGHVRHRHWIDIAFVRLCSLAMWWNPVIWLMERELKAVHEFQADADVLSSGHNRKEYQLLLVRKAASYNVAGSLGSHFAQSMLKRRFRMMFNDTPSRFAPLRVGILAVAFVLAALLITTESMTAALQHLEAVSFESVPFLDASKASDTSEMTDASDEEIYEPYSCDDDEDKPCEEECEETQPAVATTDSSADNSSDGNSGNTRTITVINDDEGKSYTYVYENNVLVSRSVSDLPAKSAPGSSSYSSSTSSSASSSSSSYSSTSSASTLPTDTHATSSAVASARSSRNKTSKEFDIDMADFEKDMAEFEKEMAEFDKEMADFDKEMAEFDKEMAGFDKEMAEFDRNMAGFDKEMANFDKEMAEYERNINSISDNYSVEIEKISADFEKEMNVLNRQMKELEKEMARCQKKHDSKIKYRNGAPYYTEQDVKEYQQAMKRLNAKANAISQQARKASEKASAMAQNATKSAEKSISSLQSKKSKSRANNNGSSSSSSSNSSGTGKITSISISDGRLQVRAALEYMPGIKVKHAYASLNGKKVDLNVLSCSSIKGNNSWKGNTIIDLQGDCKYRKIYPTDFIEIQSDKGNFLIPLKVE